MRYLVGILLFVLGCIVDPYRAPDGWLRDDLFCWKRHDDGRWHVDGLTDDCPPHVKSGTP